MDTLKSRHLPKHRHFPVYCISRFHWMILTSALTGLVGVMEPDELVRVGLRDWKKLG